ncbi:MAG: rod shape-determining protein RodA [Anaerolineae bacterium]|jgi:rod shape determining protein RodA|nr:rod shape-determining protein RodA [Anaerolineae bacterium]MBT7192149.1 rod shape-determining protein RodA [Anaerolineae bacterium]MBT7991289.1 rod shape-determining protein RodA [Anaerolineae bacterium]
MLKNLSWRHFDFWLLGAVVLAIAFGVAMIDSAVAGNAELVDYPNRQAIFAAFGLVVIVLVAAIDYNYWLALYRPIYIVMMTLLILLFMSARAVFGAARWFRLGAIFIQPTELAKLVVILILARYFEQTKNEPRDLRWIISSLLWAMGLTVWILLQPNLSNVIVIVVIWGVMIWMNGLQLKHLVSFAVGGIGLVIAGFPFLQEYQQQRVLTFIFPDPNATYGETYNIQQALIAIGSGGWLGKGYGQGTQVQLRFLKVRHTDFIFSAISEEFGFIGALIVIATLAFILWRCILAARLARDTAGSTIAFGVAALIFFQGAVNISVNLNLIPVSGLPLPFISYGGSGLVSLMLGIGLVESVIMRQKSAEF